MAEVRLPAPVKATLVEEREFWKDDGPAMAAGSVAFAKQGPYGKPDIEWDVMWYVCPCGCGSHGCLPVGNGFKPDHGVVGRATWHWDGNREAPTLSPSVHHVGHWHGWLKAGFWIQA